jgi:hypothetical protein
MPNREDSTNEHSGELSEAALESVAGGGNMIATPQPTITLTRPISTTPVITEVTGSTPPAKDDWSSQT